MTQHTIVVGDIHGCYDELLELLDKVAFSPNDRVIAVGDLIVKGPKNREVLDLFSADSRFSAVLGNHDLTILRRWRGEPVSLKESQKACLDELQEGQAHHAAYLESLPLMIDLGTHLVVHAGVRPGVPLSAQSIEDLTELRTLGEDRTSREGIPWYEHYQDEKLVVFGHWPAPVPRLGRRAYGIDTGCVYGFKLTAYVIETGRFVAVQARLAYDQLRRKS